ncbi:hypothetical protein AcW2_000214 [Taiwanofungus camphoratus]|nr:hypothetical protein AcW2_000214 [Antrodia cinnamomea]
MQGKRVIENRRREGGGAMDRTEDIPGGSCMCTPPVMGEHRQRAHGGVREWASDLRPVSPRRGPRAASCNRSLVCALTPCYRLYALVLQKLRLRAVPSPLIDTTSRNSSKYTSLKLSEYGKRSLTR